MTVRTALIPLFVLPLALIACTDGGDDGDDTDTDTTTDTTDGDDTDGGSSDDDTDAGGSDDDTDQGPQAISAEDYEGTWHADATTGEPCQDLGLSQVEVAASSPTAFSVTAGDGTVPCTTDPAGVFGCTTPSFNSTRFVVVGDNVGTCGVAIATTLTGQLGDGSVTVELEQSVTPAAWSTYVACPGNYATTCEATYTLLPGPLPDDTDVVVETPVEALR